MAAEKEGRDCTTVSTLSLKSGSCFSGCCCCLLGFGLVSSFFSVRWPPFSSGGVLMFAFLVAGF
ncbi:hypothetical protein TSUD_243930 [Trifolium subterraneum]|uniref:Transmembrane protein n=1 Tax=Trifolium subterraneum TaxID=3900 RepID=A0A2Z6NHZ3_TRISU|nr:hypothetical protein TSUD_243930 [Trifolium subterraneum]